MSLRRRGLGLRPGRELELRPGRESGVYELSRGSQGDGGDLRANWSWREEECVTRVNIDVVSQQLHVDPTVRYAPLQFQTAFAHLPSASPFSHTVRTHTYPPRPIPVDRV